jgi:hypothetical protein
MRVISPLRFGLFNTGNVVIPFTVFFANPIGVSILSCNACHDIRFKTPETTLQTLSTRSDTICHPKVENACTVI